MADIQASRPDRPQDSEDGSSRRGGLRAMVRGLLGRNGDSNLRDTFEELLEEHDDRATPIATDERRLLENILKVGEMTAYDVMVPRADIVSLEADTPLEDVVATMTRLPHSRYPVYRDSPDEVIGMVHIKDVFKATTEQDRTFSMIGVLRDVLFVAPSMRALDLLLEMRINRLHMALVVDEYGGVDGLVTIEDLVEEIVGEIEDEHDIDASPKIHPRSDGTYVADARYPLEDLEERFGAILTAEEREEDIDTLGGLVFHLAERVPTRGELIAHEATGIEFEVVDADPRRIKRLRLRNLSATRAGDDDQS